MLRYGNKLRLQGHTNLQKMVANLEEEAQNWKLLGFNEVSIVTLGGVPALVMPYIRQTTREGLKEDTKKKAVQEAARDMVDRGLCHGDIHFRHVGFLSPKYELTRCFLTILERKENSTERYSSIWHS
jgi:hypothetical protein